jgi:dihydrofolate synthase/folylpolyglutamate synthase
MTPDEALAFWYGRIDFERRQPRPDDLKLDRMRAILRLLGDPQDRLRIVHVTGSKGKGSVCAFLAAIARAAGHRTGLFTSPHLSSVAERIQVDGVPITPAEMAAGLSDIRPAVETLDERGTAPTFFEVATALGFLHFVRRRCELVVVEVGLGGRFDSTNVCRPLVAVITSVSLDHTHILGDTAEAIAFEKAGIVKAGRPCVSGVTEPGPATVIAAVCQQRHAPLRCLGRDFDRAYEPGLLTADGLDRPAVVRVRTDRQRWPALELGLLGAHQAANAAVAVATVEELRAAGMVLPDAAVAAGLRGVVWPARLEVVGRRPLVLVDCAHNVASAVALAATLRESVRVDGRRWLVFGSSADKDVPGILAALAGGFDGACLTRFGTNPRAVPPAALAEVLARVAPAIPATTHERAADAWAAVRAAAGPADLICVTGSVFLAGELRSLIQGC